MLNVDVVKDGWDFLALGFGILSSLATVWAVWFSVVTARRARTDQQREADRRRKAEEELLAEQRADAKERLRAAAELEAVRQESAAEARRLQREQEATRMAERQAALIRPVGRWDEEWGHISGDLHARIYLEIINDSDSPITDVSYRFERRFGTHGAANAENGMDTAEFSVPYPQVPRFNSYRSKPQMTYVFGHSYGDDLGFTVRFTDQFQDAWELSPDGELKLRAPRKITVEAND